MDIVVGVTGGIAAYKVVHVVRRLVLEGHDVHVVPTADALRFVGLATWEAISRNPVTTSVHDDVAQVRHVALGQRARLVIVAPATANTLARMAAGLADDLLGTTLLATTAPVVVVPAMHTEMWRHPATVANVATLRARGVHVVGPGIGALTGSDSGPGRMSEPDEIVEAALAVVEAGGGAVAPGRAAARGRAAAPGLAAAPGIPTETAPGDLAGLRVAVSTGGTREPIDPVRFIGNRSSGRQGVEVALAAARRGAEVDLVAAHVDDGVLDALTGHPGIRLVRVGTASELENAMTDASAAADVVVMVAAVADYRPERVADQKLRKEDGPLTSLALVQTPDILAGLAAARRPGQTIVGFAAETRRDDEAPRDLLARAARKRERKGADLLVVNEVGWATGFETADNAVVVIATSGPVAEASGTKASVADVVWDAIVAQRLR